jgi:hypothetical protein
MNLIAYRYNGSDLVHYAWRTDSELSEFLGFPGRRVLKVAKRPINWDELGSSAKDLWEERAMANAGLVGMQDDRDEKIAQRAAAREARAIAHGRA